MQRSFRKRCSHSSGRLAPTRAFYNALAANKRLTLLLPPPLSSSSWSWSWSPTNLPFAFRLGNSSSAPLQPQLQAKVASTSRLRLARYQSSANTNNNGIALLPRPANQAMPIGLANSRSLARPSALALHCFTFIAPQHLRHRKSGRLLPATANQNSVLDCQGKQCAREAHSLSLFLSRQLQLELQLQFHQLHQVACRLANRADKAPALVGFILSVCRSAGWLL